jgi:hypothetical protein
LGFHPVAVVRGEPKYSEKTYPSATSSTANATWLDVGSNPDRRGGNLVTNRLSYGTSSPTYRLQVRIVCGRSRLQDIYCTRESVNRPHMKVKQL